MISKLTRWVEYGSFVLAVIAGLVNSIGLLGFNHQAISHLSGTATLLGTGIVMSSFSDVIHLLLIIFSFVIGAAISGFYLRGGALKLGRNYSGLLYLEVIFLLTACYFLNDSISYGLYFASAACGLQNAFATTYSGAVIRTTHVTGIFTDLGIMLGAKLRGELFDKRKALLLILIIAGFIIGGLLGALSFSLFNFLALLIPAGLCLLLAFSYSVYTAKVKIKAYRSND